MDTYTLLKYGSRLIVLFMCIPVHEFAHAWAATKLGDESPRYRGRLTLNPFAHLDLIGSLGILFCGFGWGKPVEVNPLRFKKYRKGMALTAAAGPISNLICAFIGTIVYKVLYAAAYANYNEVLNWLALIFYYIVLINVGLAVFNLIPIYPLDGQKIFAYFASPKVNAFFERYQNYIAIGFLILLFTNILDTPISIVENLIFRLLDLLTIWLSPILSLIF